MNDDIFRRFVTPRNSAPNVLTIKGAVCLDGRYNIDGHNILDDLQNYANTLYDSCRDSNHISKLREDISSSVDDAFLKQRAIKVMDALDFRFLKEKDKEPKHHKERCHFLDFG